MAISFIFCYARSGGTLLNKCLSNIDELVVLSEIHPINDIVHRDTPKPSIAWQAKEWYGIDVRASGYLNQIQEINEWCERRERYLVIRDWSFIDFTPNALNNYCPENISTSFCWLKERFELNSLAFVRDAIDVGLSRGGDLNDFAEAYSNYIEFILKNDIAIFKYEDFCKDPNGVIQDMGLHLHFPFYLKMIADCNNRKVIGDTNISRGNVNQSAIQMKRKYASHSVRRRIDTNAKIAQVNSKLGYPVTYASAQKESMVDSLLFRLKKHLIL